MLISCVLPSCSSIKCSSGLWSPISNPSSPDFTPLNSFSAFGHSFNLTGGEFFYSNVFLYSNTGREMLCLHSTGLSTDSVSILALEREDYVGTFVKNLVIYSVFC